ncbi:MULTISPECIES: hemin uptake protein HemP [unclassified Rhodosalinus]|uniref:hemin uptake protein HemP n=1 Tax=unclassified Rhodosalinus TaxID=2630183 RepID=UPI003523BA87
MERSVESDRRSGEASCAGSLSARPDLPRHDAHDLMAGGSTAEIDLDGQIYTLRITRAGKLILTK